MFGVKVCKHVKSNAIVIVREYKPGCYALLGMGAGQPNRVDSLKKLAVARARENIRLMVERATQYGQHPKDIEADVIVSCIGKEPMVDFMDRSLTKGAAGLFLAGDFRQGRQCHICMAAGDGTAAALAAAEYLKKATKD